MKKGFALGTAGVMVLIATAAWGQGVKFNIAGYQVEGNTLLPEAEVQQILSGYTGAGRGLEDVKAAAEALRKAYEQAGYPVVSIFPPEQAASGGNILLKVVEGKVKTVTIKGNQAYDEANIRASLPGIREGLAPNAPEIVSEIAMANENPAKQVAVNFQAGQAPGAIDTTINVVEDRPEKFIATFDNGGSKSTGVHRFSLGYQNANLFNRDHMVTAQVGSSTDFPSKSLNISAGYRIPFYGHGLSLDLIAAYSDTNSGSTIIPGGSMNFTGKGTIFGARLNQPLAAIGEYRHKLIYGFDYKDFDNRASTCVPGAPAVSCSGTITTQPVSVSYVAQHNTPGLQVGGSAMFAMNIPGGPNGNPGDYATSTTGWRANWNVWRFNAFVGIPLAADWQFRANAAAQLSDYKLVSGEQFGAGGASSVRGYTERAIAGDQGYSGNLELYTPELAALASLPSGYGMRGVFFYDAGQIYNRGPGAQPQRHISSVGAGLRFNVQRDLSARLDFGVAQDRLVSQTAGVGRERGDTYGQFAVNYSF
ncbi:MAG: ShlB/FhaC/HecB family hemolysin secretion/activation protein [Rhodocyclaceae bacterium]|nr:ShlB/FhaC/HecB family hemolysin secretion/activation protein [Rhodocyclaceae bacterium]